MPCLNQLLAELWRVQFDTWHNHRMRSTEIVQAHVLVNEILNQNFFFVRLKGGQFPSGQLEGGCFATPSFGNEGVVDSQKACASKARGDEQLPPTRQRGSGGIPWQRPQGTTGNDSLIGGSGD
jgi:hypothetical protein